MKVGKLHIYWRYEKDKPSPVSKNLRDVTACIVENEAEYVVEYGEVSKAAGDTPNREVARKRALTKAIAKLPREVRAEIWEAYRTMTKVPRWTNKKHGVTFAVEEKNIPAVHAMIDKMIE